MPMMEDEELDALVSAHVDALEREAAEEVARIAEELELERDPEIMTESELRLMDGNR